MMIETPVIQIYRSAGCHTVICNTHLGMAEAGCPLIDSYSMFYESVIKGSCNAIDKFLIRNPRCDNSDIHSALCSKAQSMRHFVGNDQIRCHKPTVFFCLVCHADIHFLAYLFIIHRNIRIRLHKSILLSLVVVLHEKLTEIRVIFIFLTDSIPHL